MVEVKTPRKFGASIQPKYIHRDVPVYGLSKIELDQVSKLNTSATTYFSISSVIAGYAVAIFTNAAFYSGKLTPVGELATKYLAPGMIALAGVFLFLGWSLRSQRDDLLSHLMGEDGKKGGEE